MGFPVSHQLLFFRIAFYDFARTSRIHSGSSVFNVNRANLAFRQKISKKSLLLIQGPSIALCYFNNLAYRG